MLAFLIALIDAAVAPGAAKSAAICEVGRAALHDLPAINHNRTFNAYYAGADAHHRDLLQLCPKLRSELPAGYPLAGDDARARAAIHGPLPANPRPAFVYAIDAPEISDDLKMAIVHMGYECTGLCGARFVATYRLTPQGWQRQGEIRLLFVS